MFDKSRADSNKDPNFISTGPGPAKFRKSRTESDRSVFGPSGQWIPASNQKSNINETQP